MEKCYCCSNNEMVSHIVRQPTAILDAFRLRPLSLRAKEEIAVAKSRAEKSVGVSPVNTLIRAARLLDQFTSDTPRLTLRELSSRSGLPRATTYRLLVTLQQVGFVQYDPQTQLYRLGYKLLALGALAQEQIELRNVARRHMEWLRDATGDTVQLQIVDGDEGVYIEKVEAREGFRMWTHVGMRRPLHAGCSMKVILAHLPDAQRERILAGTLERFTDLTITDAAELRKQLEDIRQAGYAVSYGESRSGVTGIAAPIRDASRHVIGSMSLLGPAGRFSPERIQQLIPHVLEAAVRISEDLGYPRRSSD